MCNSWADELCSVLGAVGRNTVAESSSLMLFAELYRPPCSVDLLVTFVCLLVIQGLSKRFERFKFGIFYVLIVKIRYSFTHK